MSFLSVYLHRRLIAACELPHSLAVKCTLAFAAFVLCGAAGPIANVWMAGPRPSPLATALLIASGAFIFLLFSVGLADLYLLAANRILAGCRVGATHAAAWMNRQGDVVCVREDVGRHNALDKLIGALAFAGTDFSEGTVLITSRASYEMVQKSAMMGISVIAAISAPTSLAVQLARDTGVSLVGFMREQSYVVYAHAARIQASL